MKDDLVYIRHIRDAIEKIETYLLEVRYEQFSRYPMMVDAVIRQLAIIGEATNNLSDAFRDAHSEVPFRDIIDMRNILVHDYMGVNVQIVWDTCKRNLPVLKTFVNRVLAGG